jgi:glycosyltransferase involved in cell wall biosynthesis
VSRLRLGVYADLVYRRDGDVLSTDRSFVNFVTALPPRVAHVTLFGRLDPRPGRSPYVVAGDDVSFVPLPHYESVFAVGDVVRAIPASCRTFARAVDDLDAVWLFGPAPLAVAFAITARRRRVPLFLGVRQDYPEYVRNRLPGRSWAWAVVAAYGLELAFRLLARRAPTVTVGEDLARNYAGGDAPVLPIGLSLIRREDIVAADGALQRSWDGELRVLSVARLDPEKNPLLMLDILTELRRRDERWRLAIAGTGPLEAELSRETEQRGLAAHVDLLGYVPNGPELWEEYRRSHALLHVSLTEGLPQVLFEAQAAGLPIAATAVGGVADALQNGELGLLIPPRDRDAAVEALERLATDQELRERLIRAGIRHAESESLELQADRVVDFFERQLADR